MGEAARSDPANIALWKAFTGVDRSYVPTVFILSKKGVGRFESPAEGSAHCNQIARFSTDGAGHIRVLPALVRHTGPEHGDTETVCHASDNETLITIGDRVVDIMRSDRSDGSTALDIGMLDEGRFHRKCQIMAHCDSDAMSPNAAKTLVSLSINPVLDQSPR